MDSSWIPTGLRCPKCEWIIPYDGRRKICPKMVRVPGDNLRPYQSHYVDCRGRLEAINRHGETRAQFVTRRDNEDYAARYRDSGAEMAAIMNGWPEYRAY